MDRLGVGQSNPVPGENLKLESPNPVIDGALMVGLLPYGLTCAWLWWVRSRLKPIEAEKRMRMFFMTGNRWRIDLKWINYLSFNISQIFWQSVFPSADPGKGVSKLRTIFSPLTTLQILFSLSFGFPKSFSVHSLLAPLLGGEWSSAKPIAEHKQMILNFIINFGSVGKIGAWSRFQTKYADKYEFMPTDCPSPTL